MPEEIINLFVYGTLRSGVHHPAHQYISRYFVLDGEGTVQGKLYDLGPYPGAIPVAEEFFITGELYHARDSAAFETAIEQLDEYEGIYAEAKESPLFRRDVVTVHIRDQEVTAWIHWYNREITGKWIVSGDILHAQD